MTEGSFARDRRTVDVTVVGGGIIGICAALSLAERGLQVNLIDRAEPGQGASYGNAGVISPWSIVPQSTPGLWRRLPAMVLRSDGPVAIRPGHLPKLIPWALKFMRNGSAARMGQVSEAMHLLNQPCIELFRRQLAGTGHDDLIRDSYYVHAYRDAARADLAAPGYRIRREKGAELDRIGADALRQLEPALSRDFRAAILIKGQARALAPGRIGQALADKARKAGVTITRAEVRAVAPDPQGGWHVVTDQRTLRSPKVVMAAGAWSARLLRPLGLKFPLEAERGYHVQFADPGIALHHSVMDTDGMVVASSMQAGLRVAGTAEFAGLDAPVNARRAASLERLAKAMLPDLDTKDKQSWAGNRPSLPDGLPIIGEFPQHEGLFGAFGHAHYGLMMAPKTGELVADLVAGHRANLNLAPFAPDRFD